MTAGGSRTARLPEAHPAEWNGTEPVRQYGNRLILVAPTVARHVSLVPEP